MDPTWYDCAPAAQEAAAKVSEPVNGHKKRKKEKLLSVLAWLAVFVVVMGLIVVTSLAFGEDKTPAFVIPGTEVTENGLPRSWHDYIDGLYTNTITNTAKVDIPKVAANPDSRLDYTEAGTDALTLKEVYEKCAPSIVGIKARANGAMGYSWGTGIVLSADGLIVTNTHVLEGTDSATVILFDDRECKASLVGADAVSDIALLKITANDLVPAEFGDSGLLEIGDEVAALGNPLGEDYRLTLTNGIVSAIDRGVNFNGHDMLLIQTNTAINEGNSGGPLLNMYGQVVGVTNMKVMSTFSSIEGIGFAIPSSTVKSIVNSLIEDGSVVGRPSIGIVVGGFDEIATGYYGLPSGLVVTDVSDRSDARKQGLQVYDIILEVNGIPVSTTDQMAAIKSGLSVGDTMHFKVWREGQILEMDIRLVDSNEVN